MGHEHMMPADLNLSHCAADSLDSGLELISPSIQQWPHFEPALRLGVMASGEGSNFEAIQDSISAGELKADIRLLVINNQGCGAEERAERLNIPCQLLDHRLFETREHLDHALVNAFLEADVDMIVMAGWMRIVTPVLIEAFPDRLLNIHPSLLPSFKGLDAVGQALQASVRISGCTAHLVQADVDTGPVIAQAAVPVLQDDSPESLALRIQSQEHRILPWAIALAGMKWRQTLALWISRDQG
jgi:phosphoribosylglycinamide formyltransferase-1